MKKSCDFLLVVLLVALAAFPLHADDAPPIHTYHSDYFDKPLIIKDGVWGPAGVMKDFIPFITDHAALFKDKMILDIGTGCGVLSLSAIKLGARKVVATDIDTRAIESAIINAKRLGYSDRLETRLVTADNPGAFAPIKPNERFDIIISNPPYTFNLDQKNASPTDDNGALALSIIKGLRDHLKPGGYALLLYDDYFSQMFMAQLARANGFKVRMHNSIRLTGHEMDILMRHYGRDMAKQLDIDPAKMEQDYYPPEHASIPAGKQSPLIDGDAADKAYPGVIVIHPDNQARH